MRIPEIQQIGFSTVLFDTFFGLIMFFNLDSFLDIKSTESFVFYLFTMLILVHWWLIFKSADDAFGNEVTDSATDLIFGIIYLALLEYVILYAKTFNYEVVTGFLVALFVVDLVWALIWRYVGNWATKERSIINRMEHELDVTIVIDLVAILLFTILAALSSAVDSTVFVIMFIFLYIVHIAITFRKKIIDIRIF